MDERRKTLGRRIKRARLRAGYRSQKAFADEIGISENSVARAETGDERVGESVFVAIESGLPWWPDNSIERFLETGDDSLLPVNPTTSEVDQHRGQEEAQRTEIDELRAMAAAAKARAEESLEYASKLMERIDKLGHSEEHRAAQ